MVTQTIGINLVCPLFNKKKKKKRNRARFSSMHVHTGTMKPMIEELLLPTYRKYNDKVEKHAVCLKKTVP